MKEIDLSHIAEDIKISTFYTENLPKDIRKVKDDFTHVLYTGNKNPNSFVKIMKRWHHNTRKQTGNFDYKMHTIVTYAPYLNFDSLKNLIERQENTWYD